MSSCSGLPVQSVEPARACSLSTVASNPSVGLGQRLKGHVGHRGSGRSHDVNNVLCGVVAFKAVVLDGVVDVFDHASSGSSNERFFDAFHMILDSNRGRWSDDHR